MALPNDEIQLPRRLGLLPFKNKVLLPGAVVRLRCTSPARWGTSLRDFDNAVLPLASGRSRDGYNVVLLLPGFSDVVVPLGAGGMVGRSPCHPFVFRLLPFLFLGKWCFNPLIFSFLTDL